jgi:hypothetical protein
VAASPVGARWLARRGNGREGKGAVNQNRYSTALRPFGVYCTQDQMLGVARSRQVCIY